MSKFQIESPCYVNELVTSLIISSRDSGVAMARPGCGTQIARHKNNNSGLSFCGRPDHSEHSIESSSHQSHQSRFHSQKFTPVPKPVRMGSVWCASSSRLSSFNVSSRWSRDQGEASHPFFPFFRVEIPTAGDGGSGRKRAPHRCEVASDGRSRSTRYGPVTTLSRLRRRPRCSRAGLRRMRVQSARGRRERTRVRRRARWCALSSQRMARGALATCEYTLARRGVGAIVLVLMRVSCVGVFVGGDIPWAEARRRAAAARVHGTSVS